MIADIDQARMFRDLDLDKAEYMYFDGKNKLDPPYQV